MSMRRCSRRLRENIAGDGVSIVVTTNIDAQRTAIWDMGKIAASGEPGALELFRNVLTASASVPGVFSPVLIDVEADGKRFAEMHVDGGVTTNVLDRARGSAAIRYAVVCAGRAAEGLYRDERQAGAGLRSRDALHGADRGTLVRDLGSRQYAQRAACLLPVRQTRNWEFNLASIDPDYPKSTSIGFDPTYMQQLFEYGYRRGRSGKLWQSTPSDLSLPAPPRVAGR